MVDAIILAGGFGTRLRDIVPNVPKPLAPINGVPFLDLLIDQIEKSGVVEKIVLAVGYRADAIIQYFENRSSGVPVLFSREEEPLGTGGAVRQAISLTTSDQIFVFNGDSYLNCSLSNMLTRFFKPLTIAYTYVENASRFGQLVVNSQNQVLAFREKSQNAEPGWINGGIYLFDRKVFDRSLPVVFSLEKDLFPQLLKDGVFGFRTDGIFIDIGTPESFAKAQMILQELQETKLL